MLKITILGDEMFDPGTNKVSHVNNVEVELEHSLVSLSKWESFYEKPFLNDDSKSPEEMLFYIECMVLNDVSSSDINRLSKANIEEINKYINTKRSATWFNEAANGSASKKKSEEVVTSELIYYWMVAYTIPWEAQHWHLNRLMNLVRICNIKNQPEKKMNKKDLMSRNRALNQARRARMGSTG